MLYLRHGGSRCEKMAKVFASLELILDTIKCPTKNKDGVVMASSRVRCGASYSVAEESPCAVVTSDLRPKGRWSHSQEWGCLRLSSQGAGASELITGRLLFKCHPRLSPHFLRLIINGGIFDPSLSLY